MKTIEISDEMHAKLIELANEMTTQDPRCTRMPHIFQIRDWKRVYDADLNGDNFMLVDYYGYEGQIESASEFKEYLDDHGIQVPEDLDLEDLWSDHWELEEFLEEHHLELKMTSYSLEPVYTNAFLTAKAAEEHLESNYYHYHKDADVYLNHAWRNPEAELLSEFLCGLVGKKMHT